MAPLVFVGAVLLGLGCGCLLLPFTQLFADVQQTLKLLLGYGLFLTPAVYQPRPGTWFATIVYCNPASIFQPRSWRGTGVEIAATPEALGEPYPAAADKG